MDERKPSEVNGKERREESVCVCVASREEASMWMVKREASFGLQECRSIGKV